MACTSLFSEKFSLPVDIDEKLIIFIKSILFIETCYIYIEPHYIYRNIQVFVQRVSDILDTPAKMTLWSFVLPLLSSSHKAYVFESVALPDSITSTNGHSSTIVITESRQTLEGMILISTIMFISL